MIPTRPCTTHLPDEGLAAVGGERLLLGAPDDGHLALVIGPVHVVVYWKDMNDSPDL